MTSLSAWQLYKQLHVLCTGCSQIMAVAQSFCDVLHVQCRRIAVAHTYGLSFLAFLQHTIPSCKLRLVRLCHLFDLYPWCRLRHGRGLLRSFVCFR